MRQTKTVRLRRLERVFITAGISAAALVAVYARPAGAATLTYDFTATAKGGPLNGDVFDGVFSVDSASVAAGTGNINLISFNVLGTILTGSEAVFGLVPYGNFAADGTLTGIANFLVVGPARAANAGGISGAIALPSPITSLNFDDAFNYGIDPNAGENFGGGAFAGSVVGPVTIIAEPMTLSIIGSSLLTLGFFRHRRG